METITTTTDEGDPSPGLLQPLFPVFLLVLLSASCHRREKVLAAYGLPLKKDSIVISAMKHQPVKKAAPPIKKKKKIYLTFDDGPNKGTKNVLDIVQQENIPVTFFIVGEHVFASTGQNQVWDSLKAARNIELCNHSYTHAHNRYESFYEEPATVVKDMERTKDELLPENKIVRAPGRNSWRIDSLHYTDIKKSKAAIDSLQKAGFIVMGWDLEWHYDTKTFQVKNNADELLKQVDSVFNKGKTKYPGNLVLLAHDQVYHSPEDSLQLRTFIQKIKTRDDYELSLVSAYPAIRQQAVGIDSLKAITNILKPDTLKKNKDSL